MATFLITHTDLDGIAAAVLAKKSIPDLTSITYSDYRTIDAYLTHFVTNAKFNSEDLLLIVDISPLPEVCQLLENRIKDGYMIEMLDHHESRSWIQQYPWAIYNPKKCGTTLLYDHLSESDPILKAEYQEFVLAVEAWDIWLLTSPFRSRGENLHSLFNFIGSDNFIKTFTENANADQSPVFTQMLSFIEQKKKRLITSAIEGALTNPLIRIDSLGRTFLIAQATDYLSEIAHAILQHPDYNDLKYVIIYNPLFETCSVRGQPNVDVSQIAKKLNGGGHKQAAGFPFFTKKSNEETIFKLVNAIEY